MNVCDACVYATPSSNIALVFEILLWLKRASNSLLKVVKDAPYGSGSSHVTIWKKRCRIGPETVTTRI